ncbi:MAG: hypothetical protein KUL82_11610 [Bdellovibrio sp.]|nr:hypothetical protein [Bdellovibrio sp.]
MRSLLFIFSFHVSCFAFAGGDWVGNGGNIVQCGAGARMQLLDYYETEMRGLNIDLGNETVTYIDKVQYVLKRLSKINPGRAEKYRVWAHQFLQEIQWIDDSNIRPIKDIGPVILPEGCELIQTVSQYPDEQIPPGGKRYAISQKVWNHLSEEDKAGLVLHELIYREAILNKQISSLKVRFFTGLISSQDMEGLTSLEYLKLLKYVDLGDVEYNGFTLELDQMRFFPTGEVHAAIVGVGRPHPVWGSQLQNRWIMFYRSGAVEKILLQWGDHFEIPHGEETIRIVSSVPLGRTEQVLFYENGVLARGGIARGSKIKINGQSVYVSNGPEGYVEFYPNGKLKTGYLETPYIFVKDGKTTTIQGNTFFDINGIPYSI